MIIAIQGTFRSGRTSTAKEIARQMQLPCLHVETAYRAAAAFILAQCCGGMQELRKDGWDGYAEWNRLTYDELIAAAEMLPEQDLQLTWDGNGAILNQEDITDCLNVCNTWFVMTELERLDSIREKVEHTIREAADRYQNFVIEGFYIPRGLEQDNWMIRLSLDADLLIRAHRHWKKGSSFIEPKWTPEDAYDETTGRDDHEDMIRDLAKTKPDSANIWHLDTTEFRSEKETADAAMNILSTAAKETILSIEKQKEKETEKKPDRKLLYKAFSEAIWGAVLCIRSMGTLEATGFYAANHLTPEQESNRTELQDAVSTEINAATDILTAMTDMEIDSAYPALHNLARRIAKDPDNRNQLTDDFLRKASL